MSIKRFNHQLYNYPAGYSVDALNNFIDGLTMKKWHIPLVCRRGDFEHAAIDAAASGWLNRGLGDYLRQDEVLQCNKPLHNILNSFWPETRSPHDETQGIIVFQKHIEGKPLEGYITFQQCRRGFYKYYN